MPPNPPPRPRSAADRYRPLLRGPRMVPRSITDANPDPTLPRSSTSTFYSQPQRPACPICGHPNGDCTGATHMAQARKTSPRPTENKVDQPAEDKVDADAAVRPDPAGAYNDQSRPEGTPENPATSGSTYKRIVVQEGADPFSSETHGLVTASEDIVREYVPDNAKRPSHVLVATKGQTFTREQAEQAGVTNVQDATPADPDADGPVKSNVAPEAYHPEHGGAAAGGNLASEDTPDQFDLATRFAADPKTSGSPESVPEVDPRAKKEGK